MAIIIISGRSGSGKSVALNALEDRGYYCIDNLPISLLPDLIAVSSFDYPDLAIGIDARNASAELAQFDDVFERICVNHEKPTIVFTDADDSALLKRFSETRRRHPLTQGLRTLNEAFAEERQRLAPIASRADLLIDTTALSAAQLRELIASRLLAHVPTQMDLMFESFGYKNGVPTDADFVFDARCLPNPYWDARLRPQSGRNADVIHFFQSHAVVGEFVHDVRLFLEQWLKRFEQDHRSYLTIAIGCTGGQHRSVYVAEQLIAGFRNSHPHSQIRHRDMRSPD